MSSTEVTSESWVSRLGGAVKGVLFGLVLVVVGVGLLFWNEGRAVKRAKDLEAGAGALVEIQASPIAPDHEGSLVHFSGEATTDDVLRDDAFDVSSPGLRFARAVEMYQWEQREESKTRKKVGGGTETTTTYSYRKVWDEDLIDSSAFKSPGEHRNPASMPHRSESWQARDVTVADFGIPETLVRKLHGFQPVEPPTAQASQVVVDGALYLAADGRTPDPAQPVVGDIRIKWSAVPAGPVSVIGVQRGTTVEAWQGPSGSTVFEMRAGAHSGEAMFGQLAQSNRQLTWILRGAGTLAIFIGLGLIFAPLGVLADVLPPVGSLVRVGTGLVSLLLGLTLALGTISVGWLVYRPLVGIPLAAGAVAAIVVLVILARKRGASASDPVAPETADEPRLAA